MRIRLSATATVGGSYNSQNIVLSSTGATSVSIATAASGNTVSKATPTISVAPDASPITYGETLASSTLTGGTASVAGSFAFTTPSTAPVAGTGNRGITFTPSDTANYNNATGTSSVLVNQKALTITANGLTKVQGTTLTSPVTGSTAFTSSGLVSPETIGSVTINYGSGAAAGDPAGTYIGSVTASSPTGGTFAAANYDISYVAGDLIVSASPTITTGGVLSSVNTTYGSPSASPTSFTVSGGFLTSDLTVAAPSGFEVSTTIGSGYGTSLNLTASGGTVATTTIYVRLSATTAVGAHADNVVVSGGGASPANVATASSTVSEAALTITGLSGVNKSYDGGTTATLSGTPAYVGLVNGETFSVSGTPTAVFVNKTVGTGKAITVTGYIAPSSNYTVSQPSGLTADISQIALTVSGAVVSSKPYDGTAVAAITGGSLVGVISPDVVSIATSLGTFDDVNAGIGIAVTATLTLGGADSVNYSLTQPTGLTGNITQASQTITFGPLASKLTTDAPFPLTATGGASGQPVTYSSGTPAVATVSGSTVTIVALGSTVITASQAGNSNYAAATPVAQTLTVVPPAANLVVARVGNGIQTLSSNGNSVFLDQYNASTGAFVQTVPVPDNGANSVIQSGGSSSEGALMRSPDGKFLCFPGYKAAVGGGTSGSTSALVPRVAVTVNGANGITIGATTTTQFSSNNLRSAATDGSNNFWGAGSNSGTYYMGSGTPGAVQTTTANTRVVNILNGDLYYSTGSGTVGIYKFTGLPATTAAPSLVFASGGTSPSPYGFSFNAPGTIAYVADDRTNASGGVLRYDKSGATWSLTYTLGTGASNIGARGITVDWSGSVPVVYATTAESTANRLIKITDTGSGSTATTLATSGTNQLFRGLAFAPIPAITTQPTNQTVTYGSGATFAAVASGTPSPTAQWQVSTDGGTSFSNISGAMSTTSYSFSPTVADSGKKFQVVYSNVNGSATSSVVTLTVNPQVLDPEDITLTREEDGSFTASAGDFEDFTYSYVGTNYSSTEAPASPGLYTVTATSADPNYVGSDSEDYFIEGLIPANDGVTRTANSTGFKIPIATLLGNDNQVTSEGILTNSGLSITAVTSGTGNTVSKSGAFVFYTATTPSEGGPLTFTYTLTDGTLTAEVLVSVTTVAPAPFNLDLLRVVTAAAYDEGEDQTTVTVEFGGVPNQTYSIDYSTNMSSWTSHGPVSTGATGTFEVTFSAEGDQTSAWGSMFFRATR